LLILAFILLVIEFSKLSYRDSNRT